MSNRAQAAELLTARAQLYRFLGSMYILEVDEPMLEKIRNMQFPENLPESDLQEGYELVKNYVAQDNPQILDDLAVDYAKVFLAAGEAQGLAAFPYESIYTSKKHQMMGSTTQEVQALYAARGWEPKEDMYRILEDHLGLELEYMAILIEEQKKAMEDGEDVSTLLKEQQTFLKTHLLNWVTSFAGDVNKYAQTDYYRGIAKITVGFLKQEKQLLDMGGAVWDIA